MKLVLRKDRTADDGAATASVGYDFTAGDFRRDRRNRRIRMGVGLVLVSALTWVGLSWMSVLNEVSLLNSQTETATLEIRSLNREITEHVGTGQTLDQLRGRIQQLYGTLSKIVDGEIDYQKILASVGSIASDRAYATSLVISSGDTVTVDFSGRAVDYIDVDEWRKRLTQLPFIGDVPLLADYSGSPGDPAGGLSWDLGPVTITDPYTDRWAVMGVEPPSPETAPHNPSTEDSRTGGEEPGQSDDGVAGDELDATLEGER